MSAIKLKHNMNSIVRFKNGWVTGGEVWHLYKNYCRVATMKPKKNTAIDVLFSRSCDLGKKRYLNDISKRTDELIDKWLASDEYTHNEMYP